MNSESQFPSIDLNVSPEDSPEDGNLSGHSYFHSPRNTPIDLNQLPEEGAILCYSNVESNSLDHPPNKKKNFSNDKKVAVFELLRIEQQQDGKLPRALIPKVANLFSISIRSVSRIWHEGKSVSTMNNDVPNFSSKLLNRRHQKRVEIGFDQMKNITFRRRTNIRSLSKALDLSRSTVHRRIKDGSIRPHSNPVKPYLSDDNKRAMLEFCLSMIQESTITSRPTFINMHNQNHIDEKWFYMSKASEKFYLHPDETNPLRTCKSKRFMTKIMFLAAVGRPFFDANTGEIFNGKIGICPFVSHEPAKWRSKNRVAATLEMKPIVSITKNVIRSCILQKLLPSIKEKWPHSSSRTIFIQQDNAKLHLDVNDVEFVEEAKKDGFDIRLRCQPPNSPDMSVLDLGFFRAIDSIQHQEAPSTIKEFVIAAESAFNKFPPEDLNNVFLTLQSCMIEVMKHSGGNQYKIPHMNKQKLIRMGELPNCIEFEYEILDMAKAAL